MGNHQGVLYVATRSQRYVDMARTSALSLKAVCDLPTALVTDMPLGPGGGFDRVVNIESCGDGYRDKVLGCVASPFDWSLFLDTDTFVVRNPGPVFALLDRFDIAGTCSAPWGGRCWRSRQPSGIQHWGNLVEA